MKKIVSLFILVCMFITTIPIGNVHAVDFCTTYSGSNISSQDYTRAASPIKSYLTVCDDGTFMKFQAYSQDEYIAEYYDASYHLLRAETIDAELPIFGALYTSSDYYFIITGQENSKESEKTEVFRITKYDKNWARIASAGLYGGNTTMPFRSGCVRVDEYENYLFIRTSHTMYTSADGLNHQANVTIQLDTETMQITDSVTNISNINYGYVSHSFNQFIKIDDGKIIAVDHGDAYPRSIVLVKYNTNILTGKFSGRVCSSTNLLEIPGTIGDNSTGVSVGGFEISDTSYLIAGNMVDLKNFTSYNDTRNIFVAAMSKSTDTVTVKQLTNYKDGKTSTPHLVKIDGDNFILLWTRKSDTESKIYYTKINGKGKQDGTIYEMEGNLSDCVPLAVDEKLVWYTWEDDSTSFYEINTSSLSDNNCIVVNNGHDFEYSKIKNHIASFVCTKCGEKRQMDTPTSFNTWWKADETAYYYQSRYPDSFKVGESINYWIDPEIQITLSHQNTEFLLSFSDSTAVAVSEQFTNRGTIEFLKSGTYTLTIQHKYDSSLQQKYTFNVNPKDPDKVSLDKKSLTLEIGEKYKLKPSLTPKDASSTYTWKSSNKKVATVAKNGWVKAVGTGTAKIAVTTENGKKAVCNVTVK